MLRQHLPIRENLFEVDDLLEGLGRRTARGGVGTGITTGVSLVMTVGSTIVVTRFLGEEAFGLFGMITVVTGFMSLLTSFGLARAIVQRPVVTDAQASTLFWLNLTLGLALTLLSAALAPVLVWLYDEPRLFWLHVVASCLFFTGSLATVPRALLTRRLEFGWINSISLITTAISAAAGVVLAASGADVWTLVLMPLFGQLFGIVGIQLGSRWMPGLPRRGTGVRDHLRFGGNVLGFQTINYFARNADNAMLGYAWGAGPLGLYVRAYSLMMLPATKFNEPLGSVMIPALSRALQNPPRYKRIYLAATSVQSVVLVPLTLGTVLVADPLLPMILGQQWTEMIPIYWALAPAAVVAATNSASGWLYMSCGHVDRQLRTSLVTTPIIILATAIGIQWSAFGAAVSVSCAYSVLKIYVVWDASRDSPVTLLDFLRASIPAIALSVGAMVFAMGVGKITAPTDPFVKLACLSGCYAAAVIIGLLLSGYTKTVRDCLKIVMKR